MEKTSPSSLSEEAIKRLVESNPETYERQLLSCWARDVELRGRLGDVLKVGPFRQPYELFEFPRNLLAFHALDLALAIDPNPTKGIVASALKVMVDQGKLQMGALDEHLNDIGQLLSMDMADVEKFAKAGLGYWLKERWSKLIVTQSRLERWAPDRLGDMLSEALNRINNIVAPPKQRSFAVDVVDQIGQDIVPMLVTRIPELNIQLGGGLGVGDSYLVIGARGSGKTLLGCNWAVDAIRMNASKAAIITTEMTASQLYLRLLADMAEIPYDKIARGIPKKDVIFSDWKDRLDRAKALLQENLRIYEWPREGGVSAIEALPKTLETLYKEMGGLHMVVFDWIGGALGAMEVDPGKVRMLLQITADRMASLATEYKITTVSTAQAHVDRGLNKPWVDDSSLAECKQLGRNKVGVIGITAMFRSGEVDDLGKQDSRFADEQGLCISKARFGVGGYARVLRKFSNMRFESREKGA